MIVLPTLVQGKAIYAAAILERTLHGDHMKQGRNLCDLVPSQGEDDGWST